MAGAANPRKDFRYLLELDGADAFLIQEVDTPEVELPKVEHAAPGNIPNVKTAGKMTVGDLVVKKLKPAERAETWAWDLMAQAATGLTPNFVKTGFLKEMSNDMITVVQSNFLGDAWVTKIGSQSFKGQGSENLIEEVTWAVQYYFPTESEQFTAIFGGTSATAAGAAFNAGRG